ncbi:hypothetical protein Hte_002786 [Hypoxylon texense]
MLHLRPVKGNNEKQPSLFEIGIFALSHQQWTECFRGNVLVQFEQPNQLDDIARETRLNDEHLLQQVYHAPKICKRNIDRAAFYRYLSDNGLQYGRSFQLLHHICWNSEGISTAQIECPEYYSTGSPVHPTVLDSALQSLVLHVSKGLSQPSTPHVPHHISDAWISARMWHNSGMDPVRVVATGRSRPGGQSLEGAIHVASGDGNLLCSFRKIILRTVESSPSRLDLNKSLVWSISWKPQLSLLDPGRLGTLCSTDSFEEDITDWEKYHIKLNSVLESIIYLTSQRLLDGEAQQAVPETLHKYVRWVRHSAERMVDFPNSHHQDLEEELLQLEASHPPWGFFPAMARDLNAVLAGEKDPLHIAFETGLAELFYEDLFRPVCDHRLESLLHLLCHETPSLKIIEVGAGTGGWTRHILPMLQSFERCTGSSAFSEYHYTDISGAFFEKASTRFSEFKSRMTFKSFNLERDPTKQGFQLGNYDLVIAGSVLHATGDLTASIRNIHALLKPGGHFLNVEPIAPEKLLTNFGFGLLPGWWLCKEPWRALSPVVDETTWDSLLRTNGFSGNDVVLQDYPSGICHILSVMLSTSNREMIATPNFNVVIVLDTHSNYQVEVAQDLKDELRSLVNGEISLTPFAELQQKDLVDATVTISLLELAAIFFWGIQNSSWTSIKQLTKYCKKLLWVTSSPTNEEMIPYHGLMKGFWRTIRSEAFEKHLVTLEIEQDKPYSELHHILQVFQASFLQGSPEVDYAVRDQQLMSGRLVKERTLNNTIYDLLASKTVTSPLGIDPPIRLSVGTPGLLDTIKFVEDRHTDDQLLPGEVEIETKAWALNFRDVFVALGRLEEDNIGSDCAGVITRVGPGCRSLQPGDRVCAVSFGCFGSLCRASEISTYKISGEQSFEDAASVLTPGITAWYSLVKVARLQRGEKILIHSAAGSTGQMAVEIAKRIGAEIFATVSSPEKRDLLVEKGVCREHIFHSRSIAFAQSINRVTNGYGVDVVLNSLSGESLRASFECLAPYGRFIEIGKADILANSPLPMGRFALNTSFAAVDLAHIANTNPSLVGGLIKEVMELISKGNIRHPSPLHIYSVSETEKAFRYLQGGKSTGRVIIKLDPSELVTRHTIMRPWWNFDRNASYLVVGGLGGIGREIARWMASKGARSIILPSRSGPASDAACGLISELEEQGIRVLAPKCDVSSVTSLSLLLEQCGDESAFPPIKGCINAAMALQDAVFDNMTREQWDLTIQSKVQTSKNLSRLLPEHLDFLIFLSSLSGVYGSVSQSNYAAGCTYQDSLARWRVMRGQRALSLDIGWMRSIGIIAETEKYRLNRRNAGDMGQIETEEFISVLEICCDPSYPLSPANCQLLMGVLTPTHFTSAGQQLPALLQRPLFAGHVQLSELVQHDRAELLFEPAARFKEATSAEEKADVVVRSLAEKLSRALGIPVEEVDRQKILADYGVDSLMATELREWIGKQFQSTVAVFEIMSGTSIFAIGSLVVARSTMGV